MKVFSASIFVGALVLSGACASSGASAQTQVDRTVEQYACKDIIREEGENRAIAIAFLHGYLVGKSGSSKFNVEAMEKQTDAFIEQCLDNPQARAQDVMLKVKNEVK
jgi:HPt (histidine-containing phosphotransfer) domain-containing protein